MKTVDSILASVNAAPIITHFYTGGLLNGEDILEKFVQETHPKKLLINMMPFSKTWDVIRWEDLESMRERFQKASELDSTFYYTPQAFGIWDSENGEWKTWRRPDTSEFKTQIMLSLAHGAKGLIFSDYDTYGSPDVDSAIVGGPPDFVRQDLWYVIHDNLVRRLHEKLGERLLGLRYTGDYTQARYFNDPDDIYPQTIDYLTLATPASTQNWHAGLFLFRLLLSY